MAFLKLVPNLENDQDSRSSKRSLPIVSIDGPAGAGKSTAARLLAYKLGFTLIDTGALYRCLALYANEKNVSLAEGNALAELCRSIRFQFGNLQRPQADPEKDSEVVAPKLHVYCNGVDVTDLIRTPELGLAASNISKLPEVREALLDVQRSFGEKGGIVMEGRDIGTVIFPDAEVKFYLSAKVESRARRRFEELRRAGLDISLDQIMRETHQRDEQDMRRAIAPLRQANDAIAIDSTERSLEEVVLEMYNEVRLYLKS